MKNITNKKVVCVSLLLLIFGYILNYHVFASKNNEIVNNQSKLTRADLDSSWNSMTDSALQAYKISYSNFLKDIKRNKKKYKNDEDMVPDQETAICLAEVIWHRFFPNYKIAHNHIVAVLDKDNDWRISGLLPPGYFGGVPYAEIRKKDGKIFMVNLDK